MSVKRMHFLDAWLWELPFAMQQFSFIAIFARRKFA